MPPGGDGYSLQRAGETTVEAARRIGLELDGNVLAIQGPPGTGKTYTGAHVICALVRAGLKVGVTAVSHKVIVNVLEAAAKQMREHGHRLSIVHCDEGKYAGAWGIERSKDYETIRTGLDDGTIDVVGGTAWCWARPDFEQSVDVLIVDEAGQMSLANVLATAQAARSLVLLGDPQQLEQPLQSSHPEGSEVSALYHVLNGEATIPSDKGLFLAETWRLHPDIAKFTSEVYYDRKVGSRPGLEWQAILTKDGGGDSLYAECIGSGLRYLPVPHSGNRARSAEEVATIRGLVDHLLTRCQWRDRNDVERPLEVGDILVVAPYNAQVSALIEALPLLADRIGTVDRFQGQEAPVVIYSMTSSSPEDAPRGMEFLYNRFRFNVATSRAKALCILVGSPLLFRPECRTPKQMKMANGFCRYRELARELCENDRTGRLIQSRREGLTSA
ncbi:MAG TPA: ATP-binding protein [Steroidobacteraceae bacterium]